MSHSTRSRPAHGHRAHGEGGHDQAVAVATPLDLVELQALAALPLAVTVSLMVPIERAGHQRQQNHTRVKSLLHQARGMLTATVGEQRAAAILAPALAAIDERDFWAHPLEGLALYCREDGLRHVWVPTVLREAAVVCERCQLKPLMPALQGDGRFHLLALTQHGVRLYAGSRFGLRALPLPDAPASVDAVLGQPSERHGEVRTTHAAGKGTALHFGGIGDERAKERITGYFRRVDDCVCALLHASHAPLLTAGVEFLLPLYRAISRHPRLMREGIVGSPELVPDSALHQRAWAHMAPYFDQAAREARERFAELHAKALGSEDLGEILRDAFQGRVGHLFVASDRERWGSYDVRNDVLREHDPRWPDDGDLLDVALVGALTTHATVQVVPQASLPGAAPIAAILRF